VLGGVIRHANVLHVSWVCPACGSDAAESIPTSECVTDSEHLYANPQCACGETIYMGDRLPAQCYSPDVQIVSLDAILSAA
jgi:hypothetical protein